MVRLAPVTHADLVAGLQRLGFNGPFAGGKHLFMIRGELRLTIPNPHRGDIGPDLLIRILRVAGITREDWLGSR